MWGVSIDYFFYSGEENTGQMTEDLQLQRQGKVYTEENHHALNSLFFPERRGLHICAGMCWYVPTVEAEALVCQVVSSTEIPS